jgi:hypothetical protein
MAKTLIALMASMFLAGVQTPETELQQLIPIAAWERAGITKLNGSERQALMEEIHRLARVSSASNDQGVAVIAPSVSTSMKAREIRTRARVSEVPLRRAERVLVVVRSSLFNPLNYSYSCVCGLREDAERQLNIAGPKFHVYIYSVDDELRATQLSHDSFDAD